MKRKIYTPLAELHAHLSASINPAILWSIAHDQGIKLPTKSYWEFYDQIAVSLSKKTSLKSYLDTVYHPILNPLSTGTHAVERAVYETFSGGYRSSHITLHELRFNPMKHNAKGKQDLDLIIMAALRGMERALLEYPDLHAGLIICLDRQFDKKQNEILARKAIRYQKRGIVGIDFANYNNDSFSFKDYQDIATLCKNNGLGITIHTGETDDTNDMWDAVKYIHPDRIGHGIKAAYDEKLMRLLSKRGIVLEVCPLSNLATNAVKNIDELKFILNTFINNHVLFTINTDWPETIENAHLHEQINFLLKHNILTKDQIHQCIRQSFQSSFIKGGGIHAYL